MRKVVLKSDVIDFFLSDAYEISSQFQSTLSNTRVDILLSGNPPKFEGKRARIGGVSFFSANNYILY
jgi:hypothetical protein